MLSQDALNQKDITELIDFLKPFITTGRFDKFISALEFRTRHLAIVLEDIYQPHNASAVLRTCDCFGIQDVHIIENRNRYEVNPDVALGASKWLTLTKYNGQANNTTRCLEALKEKGYRLVATTPHINDHTPETLPLETRTALIFGTEKEGLTQEALSMADDFIKIPMVGFTESLNISVSAAIMIHTLSRRLRSSGLGWQLSKTEKDLLLIDWMKNTIKQSDLIVKQFFQSNVLGQHNTNSE